MYSWEKTRETKEKESRVVVVVVVEEEEDEYVVVYVYVRFMSSRRWAAAAVVGLTAVGRRNRPLTKYKVK